MRLLIGILLAVLLAVPAFAFGTNTNGSGNKCTLDKNKNCFYAFSTATNSVALAAKSCESVTFELHVSSGTAEVMPQNCTDAGTCTDMLLAPLNGVDPAGVNFSGNFGFLRGEVQSCASCASLLTVSCAGSR